MRREQERDPAGSRRKTPWESVPEENWIDWKWQVANLIRTVDDLEKISPLSPLEKSELKPVADEYHLAITPYYASLMNRDDPFDPIRLQAFPSAEENICQGHEMEDPLAEEEHSPVPGLTHRYPDRVLMVTTNYCYMYCRHCTRKRIWQNGEAAASRGEIDKMVDYIRGNPQVRDALVSGGDPLSLSLEQLDYILRSLRSIPHLEIIRIGSRVPAVLPMKITEELVQVLEKYSPVWLNTQFNHPTEVTPEAAAAVDRLLRAGIPVNNQSVLLRGINDRPETMLDLNRALLQAKIRPYYLFQCDPVLGTGHFRTPVETGLEIMGALRGHTSGLAIPAYVVDLPGGGGKVPLSPDYVIATSEEGLLLRNYEGRLFSYPTPPAGGNGKAVSPALLSSATR